MYVNNNKKHYWAVNQLIIMISEDHVTGVMMLKYSFDHRNKWLFNTYSHDYNISLFYCVSDPTNTRLVSRKALTGRV